MLSSTTGVIDFCFTHTSTVNCEINALWLHITEMKNVNYELYPIVQMTFPKDKSEIGSKDVPLETFLFRSIVLLFTFIPIDLHYIRLDAVVTGSSFYENSVTAQHRYWRHRRSLRAVPGEENSTIVRDEVHFSPRLYLLGYLLLPIYKLVFASRHTRLGNYFFSLKTKK